MIGSQVVGRIAKNLLQICRRLLNPTLAEYAGTQTIEKKVGNCPIIRSGEE